MVDIATMPDVVEQIMGRKQEPELDALADLIPEYGRVQVPLKDKNSLAHCADLLRGLATSLDLLSRRTDLKSSQAMFLAHAEIKSSNAKMQGITRARGPK